MSEPDIEPPVGSGDSVPPTRPAAGRLMDADHLQAALTGRRVLIVDHNATNRRILTVQLHGHQMHTVDVGSPIDALHLLSDASQHFDLAILDLAMPVLDGVQLAQAIRRLPLNSGLPLILRSSLGRRLTEDEEPLFAAILAQPTRSAALAENIARVLAAAARWRDTTRSAAPPVPSPPRGDASSEADGAPVALRLLLAEDNEVNQKVGRLMLAKLGHTAEIAENGERALAAVQAAVAAGSGYDVILMDMHMPVMDGLEATRRIRAELPADRQPRIVALTASVLPEDRAACVVAGMDAYLSKPVRPQDLSAAIAEVARGRHD